MKNILASIILVVSGCSRVNVEPLKEFDANKYMGVWHEIARMNHSFEKNLTNVTATYELKPNGHISVINRGFNQEEGKWKQAEADGVATDKLGQFKVYFVPFVAGNYKIAYLSPDYSFAVVSGGTKNYLWFLSREREVTIETLGEMLSVAEALGYDTSKLIYPNI